MGVPVWVWVCIVCGCAFIKGSPVLFPYPAAISELSVVLLRAKIVQHNTASLNLFHKLGFAEVCVLHPHLSGDTVSVRPSVCVCAYTLSGISCLCAGFQK